MKMKYEEPVIEDPERTTGAICISSGICNPGRI